MKPILKPMENYKQLQTWITKQKNLIRSEETEFLKEEDSERLTALTVHALSLILAEDIPATRGCIMLGQLVLPLEKDVERLFRIGYTLLHILCKKGKIKFQRESARPDFTKMERSKLFKKYHQSKSKVKPKFADETHRKVEVIDQDFIDDLLVGLNVEAIGVSKSIPLTFRPDDWMGYTHSDFGDLIPKANRKIRRMITTGKCKKLFTAINKIQGNSFKINSKLLSAVVQCLKDPVLSMIPLDEDGNKIFPDGEAARRSHEGQLYERDRTLSLAKEFDGKLIWMAIQLCFRMRVYYSTAYLNPGGTDLAKGLLMSGDSKELGAKGWDNLLITAINALGHDKLFRSEKLDLADDMLDEFIKIGDDPIANKEWQDADSPIQYLSYCIEIADAVASGDEYSYKSSVFCGLDASTSGPMLMGIATMDENTLKLTNNTDTKERQDLYLAVAIHNWRKYQPSIEDHQVAAEVDELINSTDGNANDLLWLLKSREKEFQVHARVWLSKITDLKVIRSLVKRSVMIIGYSAQQWTIAAAIWEDHYKTISGLNPVICKVLADDIYESYGEVLPGCMEVMKGISKLAGIAHSRGEDYGFILPYVNAPMYQNYFKPTKGVIKMKYLGKDLEFSVITGFDKRDYHSTVNGASPNTVHPWDALLLMMTVNNFTSDTIRVNHDGFYCLAADLDDLGGELRNSTLALGTDYKLLDSVFEGYKDVQAPLMEYVEVTSKKGNVYKKRQQVGYDEGNPIFYDVTPKNLGITVNPLSINFQPLANEFNYA